MILKGSTKLYNTEGEFVILEWGEDEVTKQGVMRLTTCYGRVGREISVAMMFRDAKMYECWPPKG